MTLALNIPTLDTERLILRGPKPADFEPLAVFFADETRSWGFGGPMQRDETWRWFASSIGHWALHGYGFWTIEMKDTGQICGISGIWNPLGWPEPEIGWVLYEGAEGKGIAFEAAMAARTHAYAHMGFTTLTSNIMPGNDRSVALAQRMGAWCERTYENIRHGTEHLYRHPGPEASS